MESPLAMDSNEIIFDNQKHKQRSIMQPFDCKDTWADLHKQMNDSVEYTDFFRFSQSIYKNRINNDVNFLDIMENPNEMKSGFRYLQSRYNELYNYVTELESDVDQSIHRIKQLKKNDFKQMSSVEKKLLSNMFNISSESKYLRENFHGHQFVYIDNLVLLDERLDDVEDVDVLKKMYTYLKHRFVELQKYSLIQESKIEDYKNLMDELFGKIDGENDDDTSQFLNSPEDRVFHSLKAERRVVHS
uniref:Uncharacterized protein n=1 Tax=Clytia hemisphaerica TaxID=252671 RepID=A0A7M5UWC2_9CNID